MDNVIDPEMTAMAGPALASTARPPGLWPPVLAVGGSLLAISVASGHRSNAGLVIVIALVLGLSTYWLDRRIHQLVSRSDRAPSRRRVAIAAIILLIGVVRQLVWTRAAPAAWDHL